MWSLLLLSLLPFLVSGDVIRTVFCRHQCNDYLTVPESSMPTCSDEHLQMNECGTVITCDWAEAERDKVRPVANSTLTVCCYRTVIKEKGDCDASEAAIKTAESDAITTPTSCSSDASLPWLISSFLLIIVAVQTGYIMWTFVHRPSLQKVTHSQSHDGQCARPLFVARPLVDTRLV